MKVAIVTDSNSGITQKLAEEIGVTVIPMPFMIGQEEYYEDINLTQEVFFDKLKEGVKVSTSQPDVYTVTNTWQKLLKDYDEIVYIPMSSGLSTSCENAIRFAQDFDGKVQVVDNKRISATQKQSVFDAVKLANQGKTAKEIKQILLDMSMDASIYIMVDTLKYLKQGGRITPAAAAVGTLLKIKPVLQIQGQKLDKFCKVMTLTQAKKKMIQQLKVEIKERFANLLSQNKVAIHMAYTKDREKCLQFKQEVEEEFKDLGLKVEIIDPLALSIACHTGEGAIGVALCAKL